jgi:Protein of unknown function (DUF3375)
MSEMINNALDAGGRLSLPEALEMLSAEGHGAYLGHVIVLWSWALKQPDAAQASESVTVRFQSLDGRDREMEVPHLVFTEPISSLLGASA